MKHWTELEESILTHVQTLIIQLHIQWEHDIYHYTCHGVFPSDFGPCTYSNNSLLISNGAYDDLHGTKETLNRAEGSLWKNHELFQDSFISCNFLMWLQPKQAAVRITYKVHLSNKIWLTSTLHSPEMKGKSVCEYRQYVKHT